MKTSTQDRNLRVRLHSKVILLACVLSLFCLPGTSLAGWFSTTNNQGSSASTGWNAAIWKTNTAQDVNLGGTTLSGSAVAPVAGHNYSCVSNGIAFGASTANTIIRNPYVLNQPAIQTFPGDSLTLWPDTEIRFKRIAAGNMPICNFPGVGGNPGLILKGGVLNGGDDDTYPVTGLIRVDAQSYFGLGNNAGQNPTAAGRAFNVSATITGSGNLVFFNGSNYVAQIFSGNNEAYSGTWIIKSARVQADGINSLGTNSSILLDPLYALPFTVNDIQGPAEIEPGYDVNSAGTLTLANGGRMRLHQNCAFTAVTIQGTALTAGTHLYSELRRLFPNNFAAGGSGGITVQGYGPLPVLPADITLQPLPQTVYAGRTARFTVAASDNLAPPLTYAWRRGSTPLTDGPTGTGSTISGSATPILTIANVSAADAGTYSVVVANGNGPTPSDAVALMIVSASGEAYEAAVLAANPVAFYQLNETGNPATSPLAFDYVGGGVGTYGTGVLNGFNSIPGPIPTDGFSGFLGGNLAVQCTNVAASRVTVSPLNLNTNSVTITAWIKPINPPTTGQATNAGLVFSRGSGTVAGLRFSGGSDALGNRTLGYAWNDEPDARNWDSGIVPPDAQWSFVALVIDSTSARISMMNANGFLEAVHLYPHGLQSFAGATVIGDDPAGSNGSRSFSGVIDDVAVFNGALSKAQLAALYSAGLGSTASYAPVIAVQPVTQYLYAGQTAIFEVVGGGTDPLTYQWKAGPSGGPYTALSDGGKISGATSPRLVISNISDENQLEYVVVLTNPKGSLQSSGAQLSVIATGPAETISLTYPGTVIPVLQPGGTDWNTEGNWSDSLAAAASAVQKPGSTYEVYPTNNYTARLRSPETNMVATFPGDLLTLRGSSVFASNPGTNSSMAEIRFKQPTGADGTDGTVIFKRLVLAGGQLDTGNDGMVNIGGRIDVLTNAPFYNDGGNDRGFRIDALLTGPSTASIEYRGYTGSTFRSNYVHNLNITGTGNTFYGTWNVVQGTLLGTGAGSLGTNDIIVGVNGALETTYDMNTPARTVFLSGRMYLHQNHTFRSLFVNGSPLSVGTYTFAQLNAAFPTNFPNAWMPQAGAESYTNGGSGSITVLVQPAPEIITPPASVSKWPTETVVFTVVAQGNPPLFYRWRKGGVPLNDVGNISGSATNTLVITNISAANGGNYDVVVTNSIGSVTSTPPAVLTVLTPGPALDLTLDYGGTPIIQPSGANWNTVNNWSDGQPAYISSLSNPGSTYHVVAGSRLRTPDGAANAYTNFPGAVLRVEGNGVWEDSSAPASIGEIRFKHPGEGGTNIYKRLVMAGGQLDSGSDGVTVIAGQMDILANTPIYVDSAAGHDRAYQIDALLTGNGTIELREFSTNFTANLNITGTGNTFSGTWNIVQGCLLGSGLNSLGTNAITVGVYGALETLYDINNPKGTLIVDGQVFLHQNDTFREVIIAGVPLPLGTYSFAYLNATYPANFPATWPLQLGSSVAAGSGSITVAGDLPPPVTIQFGLSGGNLTLTWSQGTLLEADQVTGPWVTNTATSPFVIVPTGPQKFYRVQTR